LAPHLDSGSTSGWPAQDSLPGALQRQAWREGLLPPVEQVRPGLWSIPVPWPGSAMRYTLAYLMEVPAGVALVDTGWPTEQAWTAFAAGIRKTGHDVMDIRYVLVTHAQSDHLGLASRVRERTGAQVGMHRAEADALSRPGALARLSQLGGWLQSRGAPPDQAAAIIDEVSGVVEHYPRLASADFLIEHNSRPVGTETAIRAVWTPGHTPGHLCFYDERQEVLLTGDHVLPRITPHIGRPPGAEGDPLGDFQASLRTLAQCRTAEVLPAHEYRFADLGGRIRALLRHHATRLAEIEHAVACYPGLSTWTVAEHLTWSRGWENTRGIARLNAVSETWAHLVHLRARERGISRGRCLDSWIPGLRCSPSA
jgi:glyoxylase-like metal-dependent hydrolase (beta-lactamase superfamily II)